jgi:SulP family sulfate permease
MQFRNPFTFLKLISTYKKGDVKSDLIAGCSTGMILIPQAMAYAVIAGIPVQYGLYAALIAPLVYLFFGTSTKLVLGPAALDSMLLASSLALLTAGFTTDQYMNYVFSTVLMTGVFQLLFSILRLGFISNFFSKPLLSGFTTAAAILITFSQLKNVLGIGLTKTPFFHEFVIDLFYKIKFTDFPSLLLGSGTLVLLFFLKKKGFSKISVPLMVTLAIVMSYFIDLSNYNVDLIGNIPQGLPFFFPFDFAEVRFFDIIAPSLLLAIIGFTISMSISKSTEENPSIVNSNQELFAIGMANSVSTLFGGYQASSSFSRTAINKAAGAVSRFSNMFSSVMIVLVLLFFTEVFELLPLPVLSAVIISAMPGLMRFIDFKITYQLDRKEFAVLAITFLTTLELGVIYGLGIGVLVSGGVFLFSTLQPHIAILGRIGGTEIFKNINRFEEATEKEGQLILRIDGAIYFANVRYILGSIKQIIKTKSKLKHIIIHAVAISYVDITGFSELEEFIMLYRKKGIKVYLCTVQGPLRDMLYLKGFNQQLGGEALFLDLLDAVNFIEHGVSQLEKNWLANQFDTR